MIRVNIDSRGHFKFLDFCIFIKHEGNALCSYKRDGICRAYPYISSNKETLEMSMLSPSSLTISNKFFDIIENKFFILLYNSKYNKLLDCYKYNFETIA